MDLEIRKIDADDLNELVQLMSEFAAYEGLSAYFEADETRLHAAMFAPDAIVDGLIAFDAEDPMGYALFYPAFSSFRGELGLHLEDLYVRQEYRGRGVGLALFREIAGMVLERGLSRLDFMVQKDNTSALRFYKNLGAESNPDERHFKLDRRALESLTGR